MMKMSMVTTITTGIMIMIDNFSKMLCFDKNLYMLSSLTKLRTNSIIKTIMFVVQILYHILTIYIGVSVIQSTMSNKLKICGWNMQGSNSSLPYVKQLLYKCDILCVSEHWLYKCDQHRLDINIVTFMFMQNHQMILMKTVMENTGVLVELLYTGTAN